MPEPDGEKDVNLSIAYWRRLIADRIKEQIDEHTLANARGDGFRDHLGWSVIGDECNRKLYYHWHWFKQQIPKARYQRIFDKGDRIEQRIRKVFTERGAKFLDKVDVTGEQIHVSDLGGHFGGSVDGIFTWAEVGITEPTLLECKSSKTGAPFNDLSKHGVASGNPKHFRQSSGYGYKLGIKHTCYVCENKNDSSLYVEIIELDWDLAKELTEKAKFIILSNTLPNKVSTKKNYYLCDFPELCHGEEKPVPNCRNCANCSAGENSSFVCNYWNATIPPESIKQGCNNHTFLPY
jgi:hypothetical protein